MPVFSLGLPAKMVQRRFRRRGGSGAARASAWRGDDWATIEKKSTERITANLVGRLGRPEDIAATALFLVSEGESFITGEDFRVTGGHQQGDEHGR